MKARSRRFRRRRRSSRNSWIRRSRAGARWSRRRGFCIASRRGVLLHRWNVGLLDHLGPFVGFAPHQLAELIRRHRQWFAAKIVDAFLELGVRQYGVHRSVELVDDLG